MYVSCSTVIQKSTLSRLIVRSVRNAKKNPPNGGRFLKWNNDLKLWCEIEDVLAGSRTSALLQKIANKDGERIVNYDGGFCNLEKDLDDINDPVRCIATLENVPLCRKQKQKTTKGKNTLLRNW